MECVNKFIKLKSEYFGFYICQSVDDFFSKLKLKYNRNGSKTPVN